MEQEQKIAGPMDRTGEGPAEPEQQMQQEQETVAPRDHTGEGPKEPEQEKEQELYHGPAGRCGITAAMQRDREQRQKKQEWCH